MLMRSGLVVAVADLPVRLNVEDPELRRLLEERFSRFLDGSTPHAFEFDVTVAPPKTTGADDDLGVAFTNGQWVLRRGDFEAQWSVPARRGWIRQTLSPYAADSVLRILHTLVLATRGGFLIHASSAIRNGRAFLFTGPSGAGKSTIAGLAPPDVTVLTDEISYVRKDGDQGYVAYGTPFAGELSSAGEPARAPVAALFRLARGSANQRSPLSGPAAVRTLMRNILFFSGEKPLVSRVLDTACDFASRVPCFELAFAPDARVWEAVQ